MKNYNTTRLVITIVALFIAVTLFFVKCVFKKKPITTKFITRTAIFAAFSILLYIVPALKFPLPFFPSFLEIHFDEVPLFIAGFAYGPWSGAFALLIKTLVKLPMTNTMYVGEIADFIYSLAFILPAAIIYKYKRNFKGVLIALSVGLVCQLLVSSFVTTFVMLDFYMNMMGMPRGRLLASIRAAGINMDENFGWPFLYTVALPFNLFKDALVIVITLILYKRVHKLVEKVDF